MLEDLQLFPYFYIFGLGLASSKEKSIWQAQLLGFLCIKLCEDNIKTVLNGIRVMTISLTRPGLTK